MRIILTLLFATAIATLSVFNVTSNSSGGRYTDVYLDKKRLGCESDIYAFGSYVSFASTMAKRDRGESDRMAAATLDSEGYHPCIIRSVLKTVVGMHKNTFIPPQAVQKRFNELKKKYAKKLEARFDPDYYDKIDLEKSRLEFQENRRKRKEAEAARLKEETESQEKYEEFWSAIEGFRSSISTLCSDLWDGLSKFASSSWDSASELFTKS